MRRPECIRRSKKAGKVFNLDDTEAVGRVIKNRISSEQGEQGNRRKVNKEPKGEIRQTDNWMTKATLIE